MSQAVGNRHGAQPNEVSLVGTIFIGCLDLLERRVSGWKLAG